MKLSLVLIMLIISLGCAQDPEHGAQGNDNESSEIALGFELLKAQILQPHCLRCHSGSNPEGGINLSTEKLMFQSGVMNLSDPENSRLFKAIESGFMPPNSSVPEGSLDLIVNYVNNLLGQCQKIIENLND